MKKSFHLLWTEPAEQDLERVVAFIARDRPQSAYRIFRFIRLKAQSLRQHPKRGRMLPELSHIPGLPFREIILSPWRLVYQIRGQNVEILALFDGRRDLEDTLFERLVWGGGLTNSPRLLGPG